MRAYYYAQTISSSVHSHNHPFEHPPVSFFFVCFKLIRPMFIVVVGGSQVASLLLLLCHFVPKHTHTHQQPSIYRASHTTHTLLIFRFGGIGIGDNQKGNETGNTECGHNRNGQNERCTQYATQYILQKRSGINRGGRGQLN